jgi:hypothetical protein
VSDWTDIVAISVSGDHTVGLKSDGTVVAVGSNYYNTVGAAAGSYTGQCNVDDWRNIVAIEAGKLHTFGLKANGTVVAVGGWLQYKTDEQGDVGGWCDIGQPTEEKMAQVPPPKSGCYVATCIYGSYDCSEVWTLRRFRDDTLAKSWAGRKFIRAYYAISPKIVNRFGKKTWFNKLWKPILNGFVSKLQSRGIDDSPYYDR